MFVKKRSEHISIVWGDNSAEDVWMGMDVGVEIWASDNGGGERWVEE
jgi:hypothetical protein